MKFDMRSPGVNSYTPAMFSEQETPLDIRQLAARFRSRFGLFLTVLTLLASLVIGAVLTQRPVYTATASVLVDERGPSLLRANPDGPVNSAPLDTGRVDTQVEIIRSRTFADHVVDRFNLQADPEFNARLRKPSLIGGLRAQIFNHAGGALPDQADRIDRDGAPDALLSHLKVNRVGSTYLLNVAVTVQDPLKAKILANAFTDLYLTSQISTKADANKALNDSLAPRLATLRSQVEAAETAVEQYRVAHNLLTATGQSLTEQSVATLDQQLAMARAQQVEIEARASTAKAQMKAGSTGEDVGEALNSPVIQQLRQQRATASQKVASMAPRYGERLPAMVSARRDLADVDAQIHAEIERIISNLDAQAQVARQRTASIAGSVNNSRGDLVGNARAGVRLNELNRNLDSLRTLYETLLNRYKESSTDQGLEQAEAHVVTQAQTPAAPSAPKKSLGVILGLMVGLVGGVIAVVLAEALDATVSTADKLGRALSLPCLASLPTVTSTLPRGAGRLAPLPPLDYLQSNSRTPFAEAFRNLRTSLHSAGLNRRGFVLAVTSALPGEGRSTTATCLARTFANSGISVVVVDCDLSPDDADRVHSWPTKAEVIDQLNTEGRLENALEQDGQSGSWLLPLAKAELPQLDMVNADAVGGLVEALRGRFDLVILDTAPVLTTADTRALAAEADAALLLVRWRKTPLKAVQSALALLESTQVSVIGSALTFVNLKAQRRTGYGDVEYYLKPARRWAKA